MEYLPYDRRTASTAYRDVLRRIRNDGLRVATPQGVDALTLMQQTMAFPLAEGFPIITERSIRSFWKKAIGELCAFINGATSLEELAEFGCDWWGPWATPEKTLKKGIEPGTLGPGSYGGAFRSFPTAEGPPFDQFQHLIEQLRDRPELRTHIVSPWIPQYQGRGRGKQPRTTIAPCHGWVHVRVISPKPREGGAEGPPELHLHMYQRSGDVPIGVPSNIVQYAALILMLEQLTSYRAHTYYHTVSDAHIYVNQLAAVDRMLDREPVAFPTVVLTEAGRQIQDIHQFRSEHFELADYHPHPGIPGIPVAT